MPVVNQAVKLIYGTRQAVTTPTSASQVEGVFVDKLMHEGVPGYKPMWHPTQMSIRPFIEFNHFNIVWGLPADYLGGFNNPNSGTHPINLFYPNGPKTAFMVGGRKTVPISSGSRIQTDVAVALPAGDYLTTFAFANSIGGTVRSGLWSNDYKSTAPPRITTRDEVVEPRAIAGPEVGSGCYWNDDNNGTYAFSSGKTAAPVFKGVVGDNMHGGWGSQYWQLGLANAYRRDGLAKSITGSLTARYPGYAAKAITLGQVQDEPLDGDPSGYPAWMTYIAIWVGDTPVPLAEIEKLEGWCHWQYGYQSLLDAAHPYKNAPPQV